MGVENNGVAVLVYRALTGCEALYMDIKDAHPPWYTDILVSDLPTDMADWKKGGCSRLSDERGSALWHTVRMAVESQAQAVMVSWPYKHRAVFGDQHEDQRVVVLERAFGEAGYYGRVSRLDAVDYGTPQYRRRIIYCGFRKVSAWRSFRFPAVTHCPPGPRGGTGRLLPYVTVQDVTGIPYPFPSPPVRPTEYKSSWKGSKGGKAPPRRASEIIATMVGRGAWGDKYVSLTATQLAVLQGFPEMNWNFQIRKSHPVIGNAFQLPLGRALAKSLLKVVRPRMGTLRSGGRAVKIEGASSDT